MGVMEKLGNRDILRRVCSNLVKISDFAGRPYGTLFCPFHKDEKHPSAKLYFDKDGERIYCFAERKQYSSFDYISLVLGESPLSYVLSKFDEQVLELAVREIENQKMEEGEERGLEVRRINELGFAYKDNVEGFINELFLMESEDGI